MPGFQSRVVFAATNQDGLNWTLTQPITYVTRQQHVYVVPVGSTTNGSSAPAIVASVLPPHGVYWQSCVLHDAAYRNTLQQATGELANLSQHAADALLLEACELSGVDDAVAQVLYRAVQLFGAHAYNKYR